MRPYAWVNYCVCDTSRVSNHSFPVPVCFCGTNLLCKQKQVFAPKGQHDCRSRKGNGEHTGLVVLRRSCNFDSSNDSEDANTAEITINEPTKTSSLGATHIAPSKNIPQIWTFRTVRMRRVHTYFIGSPRIIASVATFTTLGLLTRVDRNVRISRQSKYIR